MKRLTAGGILAAALLGAALARAQDQSPSQMAQHVNDLLRAQGAMQAGALVWGGQTYALLERTYEVCASYNGACFVVRDKPEAPPKTLAFYEVAPGQLGMTELDYTAYWKDRSQNAVHFFMDNGARLDDVFALVNARNRPLFDAQGQLTRAGEAVYDGLLAGRAERWGAPGTMTQEQEPAGDPKKARAKIALLKSRGYFEVQQDEYDCLHKKFKFGDDDMSTVNVFEGPKLRIFIHDDASGLYSSLIQIYRKSGQCRPGGMTITQ